MDEDGLPRGIRSESGWKFDRCRSILGFDGLSMGSLAQGRGCWSEGKDADEGDQMTRREGGRLRALANSRCETDPGGVQIEK